MYIIYNTEIDEIYDCEDQRLLNSVLNIPGLRLIEENAYLTSAPENSRHQPRPLEAIAAKRRVILATTFSMKLYYILTFVVVRCSLGLSRNRNLIYVTLRQVDHEALKKMGWNRIMVRKSAATL